MEKNIIINGTTVIWFTEFRYKDGAYHFYNDKKLVVSAILTEKEIDNLKNN